MSTQSTAQRNKSNKNKRKEKKVEAGNGSAQRAPAFLTEFVERGRELQHEGVRQIENLRDRLQELPLGQRVMEQIELGNTRLQDGRGRLERWVNRTGGEVRQLREQLFHQLGLATARDLEQVTRRVNTMRRQLKEMAQA